MQSEKNTCPACGGSYNYPLIKAVQYKKCRECGIIFNDAHSALEYNDSYFTSDYKTQYGRTYEEDYLPIYESCVKRIRKILNIWHKTLKIGTKPESLLDLGSALGFSMKASLDCGIKNVRGLEISKYASSYAENRFGFNILNDSFENAIITEKYDIVTAWYFTEHFYDTKIILNKMSSILKKPGILALAVPSHFGPSRLFHFNDWVKTHPVDHRIDFFPYKTEKIFNGQGLQAAKIYPASYHPERVMNRRNPLFPMFKRLYRPIAKLLKFSDTIEMYFVKQ